jgi:hypothetical protein
MFTKAIENATKYTRPIHFISRYYDSNLVFPGAATIFMINKDGWALTCKHVAKEIANSIIITKRYGNFLNEKNALKGTKKEKIISSELEKKYGIKRNMICEYLYRFIGCVTGPKTSHRTIVHNDYDIVLIKFDNFEIMNCIDFPIFPLDTSFIKQGKMFCRLGFPFPEFSNFEFNELEHRITWNKKGREISPQFPIEGMLTRFLNDQRNVKYAFELSTPGIRGQSGGPVLDTEGKIWGMQYETAHLDLNFDVDQDVLRNGSKKRISDHAFLHVGHCIHAEVIKKFMDDNKVSYRAE